MPVSGERTAAAEAAGVMDGREVQRVLAAPGFDDIARQAVASWLPGDQDDAALTLLLRDLGLFFAATWALYLHAEPGGLTVGRLETVLATTGVSSRGRARSILNYLAFIGCVEPAGGGDRLYAPTANLSVAHHARLRRELTWAARLDSDIARALPRIDDPALACAFTHRHGEHALAVLQHHFRHFPPTEVSLDVFSHRAAGMIILGCLLQAADKGEGFPAAGEARFSVSQLAQIGGTSRSHVRHQLQAAAKAGFLSDLGEGRARLTPLLASHARGFIAGIVLLLAWSARRALADVEA